jgi:tRNA threonylcarbamoyladenosine biosynthesis protein TsaE
MQPCRSSSRRYTQRFAASVLRRLRSNRRRLPIILALAGELGSGKTTFVQGLARSLGIRENVQSPTFVLAKWYRLPLRQRPFRHFIHIDAYRLNTAEARRLGFPATLRDRGAIVAIEWADRIKRLIPKHTAWVFFEHKSENKRHISIKMN